MTAVFVGYQSFKMILSSK